MKIKEMLEDYIPFDDQEVKDKEYFLKCIDTFDDVLTRNNLFAHFTASAFIVNRERTKMLVVYHNIYGGWIYPGGHADGEDDLLAVAIREVLEETGLNVKLLDDSIFSIQVCPTIGHYKKMNMFLLIFIWMLFMFLRLTIKRYWFTAKKRVMGLNGYC